MFDTKMGPPKRKQIRGILSPDPGVPPDHLTPEEAEHFRKTSEAILENGRIAHAWLHPEPPPDETVEVTEDVADFLAAIGSAKGKPTEKR